MVQGVSEPEPVPGLDRTARLSHERLRRIPPESWSGGEARLIRPYTADEMMTVAAARMLPNGAVCFVGIGLPSAAANLAPLKHAPDVVWSYEPRTICSKPHLLPLSLG